MLTLRQFYLTKLIEECQEVSQRAAKSMQFGPTEAQSQSGISTTQNKDQDKTNATRLRDEVEDLLAVITLVEYKTDDLPMISISDHISRKVSKAVKIKKYLKYSQELEMVEND